MVWKLIDYNQFPGKYNMEFDLQLVKNVKEDHPILRFYGWDPHCISLGANQSFSDIDLDLVKMNGLDVVKRPTGGRAILHADELTYSVVFPNNNHLSHRTLYENISHAIVYGLKSYDSKLNDVELENSNPDFPSLLKQPSGALCFASSAKSEIKFNGKKLVGSAQRKLGSTILQHGSILIGKEHVNLVNYLNLSPHEKESLKSEMISNTIDISSIIRADVNITELKNKIIFGFEKVFNTTIICEEIIA